MGREHIVPPCSKPIQKCVTSPAPLQLRDWRVSFVAHGRNGLWPTRTAIEAGLTRNFDENRDVTNLPTRLQRREFTRERIFCHGRNTSRVWTGSRQKGTCRNSLEFGNFRTRLQATDSRRMSGFQHHRSTRSDSSLSLSLSVSLTLFDCNSYLPWEVVRAFSPDAFTLWKLQSQSDLTKLFRCMIFCFFERREDSRLFSRKKMFVTAPSYVCAKEYSTASKKKKEKKKV